MNIGVIFGSRSPEHDVSIASGYGLMQAIKKRTNYEVIPLYITKEGSRIVDKRLIEIKSFKNLDSFVKTDFPSVRKNSNGSVSLVMKGSGLLGRKSELRVDLLWNMVHGENGEDGTIAGLARLRNLPIVSPGGLAESMGMNKHIMKQLFENWGLPLVPYLAYKKESINTDHIKKTLAYPMFVKPVNLGSTIGVSKCDNYDELLEGIEVAGFFDDEIMIENGVQNLREFNCCVMEKNGEIVTSLVEEPKTDAEFLTFHEKYTSLTGGTMKGSKGKVQVPASIDASLTKRIQDISKDLYVQMKLTGGAPRVDFLYDDGSETLYVNEINMIPGSMQLPLWKASGVDLGTFIGDLVDTAISCHKKNQKNITYTSNIIDYTINFIEQQK